MTEPILFSQEQYKLMQFALTVLAKAAEEQGETKTHHDVLRLSSELEQNIHRGQGMPVELKKRFENRISVAQQQGDGHQLTRILRDFIAAQMRVEADPAVAIANTCMSAMVKANMAHAASMFIPIVQKKLAGMQVDYYKDGYPEAKDLLDFLNDWLSYGLDNLNVGDEPWPEDEHLNKTDAS